MALPRGESLRMELPGDNGNRQGINVILVVKDCKYEWTYFDAIVFVCVCS
jgi:hypothetical protein